MSAQVRARARVRDTEAEGPGRRWALWVQGCSLGCPGCCNPEMLAEQARDGGDEMLGVDVLAAEALATPGIEGVSFLGGEPFQQAAALAELAERVRPLHVMVFTGYTLAELRANEDEGVQRLLAATDLLVDGRYDRTQPDMSRRWIGSRNQVMHVLRGAKPSEVTHPNTIELRLTRDSGGRIVTVNGWPAAARSLWVRR